MTALLTLGPSMAVAPEPFSLLPASHPLRKNTDIFVLKNYTNLNVLSHFFIFKHIADNLPFLF